MKCLQLIMGFGVTLLVSSGACAAPFEFTFNTIPPGGNIAGPPGSLIGWGYTISNLDSLNWLVTTSLSAGSFLNGTPDDTFFDFPILMPSTTRMVAFDPATHVGLYGLTWNTSAPLGFTNSGSFILGAEFWSGDPSAEGIFLRTVPDQTAPYAAAVTVVPEGSTLSLLLTGLAALGIWKKRSG